MSTGILGSFYFVLISVLTSADLTSAQENTTGCHLSLNSGWHDREPTGNPLQILERIQILRIRDVPDSGGSFSVDLK